MLDQKNLGVEEYINENNIFLNKNVTRIIQNNNHLFTIAAMEQIIPSVKVSHKSKDIEFYMGDFVTFDCQDNNYYLESLLERKILFLKHLVMQLKAIMYIRMNKFVRQMLISSIF